MQPPISPPQNAADLLTRARDIAGLSLGELASLASIDIPANFQRNKGWTGQMIELWLGASAGSKPQQDFPELGIELKTIPIDSQGMPLETTYVCYAPLMPTPGITWETSNVYNKLRCVLWIPVQGERAIAIADRCIGSPVLWQPNAAQLAALKQDWQELAEVIACGNIETITSRHGEVMQLRPKAANGRALTQAIGNEGQRIQTRPRGYYLRKHFTASILKNAFAAD